MFVLADRYICPVCNKHVPQPENNGGVLRCAEGHAVAGLSRFSLGIDVVIALVIVNAVENIILAIATALAGNVTIPALAIAVFNVPAAIYMLRRGLGFLRSQGATRSLARQYFVAAGALAFYTIWFALSAAVQR